jgi:multidrug resistance efflux pump
MPDASRFVPKLTFFLGGAFVGMLLCARRIEAGSRRAKVWADGQTLGELRELVKSMEARLARQESVSADLLKQLEVRLEELAARVGETPSAPEIVTAVERLLSKTMTGLDERLSAQAQSIDLLKNTVSQTDSLLERVLESIDSLEVEGEPAVMISQPAPENPQA